VQFFEGGLMVYPSASEKKIYVLRSLSGHAHKQVAPHVVHTRIDRWAVFEDTFVP
jgi:hypothetical protein